VQLYYSEPHWPRGRIVPYQVQLDDNRLIFAPMDDDRVIRELPSSPLHDCLDSNDLNLLRELCSSKKDMLNSPNLNGDPPIIYLFSNETFKDWEDDHLLEAANILKDAGAAMGTCNMQANTILHCAAERGSVKVMEAVLKWSKEERYSIGKHESFLFFTLLY
jgi:hypothetical protein